MSGGGEGARFFDKNEGAMGRGGGGGIGSSVCGGGVGILGVGRGCEGREDGMEGGTERGDVCGTTEAAVEIEPARFRSSG